MKTTKNESTWLPEKVYLCCLTKLEKKPLKLIKWLFLRGTAKIRRFVSKWFNAKWDWNLNEANYHLFYRATSHFIEVAYIHQRATFFVLYVLNECNWYFRFNDSFCEFWLKAKEILSLTVTMLFLCYLFFNSKGGRQTWNNTLKGKKLRK